MQGGNQNIRIASACTLSNSKGRAFCQARTDGGGIGARRQARMDRGIEDESNHTLTDESNEEAVPDNINKDERS